MYYIKNFTSWFSEFIIFFFSAGKYHSNFIYGAAISCLVLKIYVATISQFHAIRYSFLKEILIIKKKRLKYVDIQFISFIKKKITFLSITCAIL